MFKILCAIGWVSLAVFTALHVWLRFVSEDSLSTILAVHGGVLLLVAVLGTFWAMWHGVPLLYWILLAVPIALSNGTSALGVHHPIWGSVVGVLYLSILTLLAYQEYLDTPHSRQNGPIGVLVPDLGVVSINTAGRTPRAINAEIRAMNARRHSRI